jgi:hypothetical protein
MNCYFILKEIEKKLECEIEAQKRNVKKKKHIKNLYFISFMISK